MARTINDSIQNNSPKSLDQKFTKFVVDTSLPYASVDEANSYIPFGYRSIGLTVLVRKDGSNKEFWYKESTLNNGLIEKVNLPVLGGFSGDGSSNSPFLLNKDTTPTQNSTNPVTSGGVFARLISFRNELDLVYNQSLTPNLQDVTEGQFNNITNQPLKIGNRLDIGVNGSFLKDTDNSLDISSPTDVTMSSGDYSIGVSTTGIKLSKYSQNQLPQVAITLPTTSGILPISVNGILSNGAGNIQLSGVSGSFTTANGKTVTVTNGIITAIV